MPQDLIAAVATPAGVGGIGIVRASGADIAPLTALLATPSPPPPRRAVRSRFVDDAGDVIDDGLVLYFPAPMSFTGEEVLELHAHGGMLVLQRLLARCLQLGARLAEPGEFTLRAYLNNKLDLTQAEALADLISAGSVAAAKAAARSLMGEFSTAVADFTRQLRQLRVAIESNLDFSDDDAQTVDAATSGGGIVALQAELEALIAKARQGARLTSGVDIVIIGATNVGKSSLLNRLADEEAAIVSDEPGTTRDLIERQIVINGLAVRITDTAGLRDTAAAIEQEGIRRALARLQSADIVMRIAAAGVLPPPLPPLSATVLEVYNKIDLSDEAAGEREKVHYVSAKTDAGIALLRLALCAAAGYAPEETAFSARTRHVAALQAAHAHLQRSVGAAPELAAAWLREADMQLQTISGGYDEEDLLGDIFSAFCIGK